ncbi:murein hydrolase activator EnvC family protein [Aquihabitans daechungensis]|uniref:murein hydrolase activator EnvC family protein n=1 Tax=Aquihabitans daechungensis TaxID=1052257 RepID=UPI003B9F6A1F
MYRPPTDAPVRDPFRPPPQPWLPGNRGIEYDTTPGDVVTAIGPGVVSFAGPVAGRLVATVVHPDGLRSSFTQLAGLAVERGDRVEGGQVIGLASGPFHLGVRRGDRYLDPASLWGTAVGAGRVLLVPDRGREDRRRSPAARSFGAGLRRAVRAASAWP